MFVWEAFFSSQHTFYQFTISTGIQTGQTMDAFGWLDPVDVEEHRVQREPRRGDWKPNETGSHTGGGREEQRRRVRYYIQESSKAPKYCFVLLMSPHEQQVHPKQHAEWPECAQERTDAGKPAAKEHPKGQGELIPR